MLKSHLMFQHFDWGAGFTKGRILLFSRREMQVPLTNHWASGGSPSSSLSTAGIA